MGSSFDLSWVWSIGLISFAFGVVCGLGASLLLRGKRQRIQQLENELDELQQQFDGYREQVTEHFLTTSALVQKMTDSYKDVYEHLASGSQVLCEKPVTAPSLDFTRQPVLESTPANQTEETSRQAPEQSDATSLGDNEIDTCLGDSPHVPSLDTEQSATHRTL
jgi:uncharacterized membrane-anchored protein YhcB (DUF1043 family)